MLPVVDLGPVSGYNEYSVANTYASIEEARAHYDGVIPDIAMPEEFRLVEVCLISGVSGDVELHYSCGEEEAYIWFSGSEQVQPSGEAYYRVAGDGSLRRMRDTIVRIRNYDSGAVSASISSRDFNCTLAFYNIDDMERIQAIIAGLCP